MCVVGRKQAACEGWEEGLLVLLIGQPTDPPSQLPAAQGGAVRGGEEDWGWGLGEGRGCRGYGVFGQAE